MDEIRQIADTATIMRNGRIVETVSIVGADTARIIELMIGADPEERAVPTRTATDGEVLLTVRDLTVAPKLSGVSFEGRAGEVLGIAGLLGSGRTELLEAIAGFRPATSGTVAIAGTVVERPTAARMLALGVGMTPEDRKGRGVVPHLGIDENIVMSDFGRVSRAGTLSSGAIAAATRTLADRLSIKAHDLSRPISTLSGGNQQKAVIARWLHADSRVLLLDEPSRGVDVEAKAQIYEIMRAVADTGKLVVFVSSEIEELPLACDRVLVLREGGLREEFRAPDISLPVLLQASMVSS
jgi:ABC-type sugar transport system ATPase subunit